MSALAVVLLAVPAQVSSAVSAVPPRPARPAPGQWQHRRRGAEHPERLLAEPLFYTSALPQQLTSQFGEQFTEATGPILPLDEYPGDATALQELGPGRMQAIAEPVRLGGGSALVVSPSR